MTHGNTHDNPVGNKAVVRVAPRKHKETTIQHRTYTRGKPQLLHERSRMDEGKASSDEEKKNFHDV